ncbi:hypothetical protein K2173_016505 [Erythroxylum novogranatense]|uniref:Uncharacterized protein n=1 Tax=Erythroxylum novogranatense TaxID=1862640 RepID=A0AAV8SH44_9ROSI|nr:hypothetical protein K2173_016505 [Erythroxylum novogranatense]
MIVSWVTAIIFASSVLSSAAIAVLLVSSSPLGVAYDYRLWPCVRLGVSSSPEVDDVWVLGNPCLQFSTDESQFSDEIAEASSSSTVGVKQVKVHKGIMLYHMKVRDWTRLRQIL